MTKNLRKRQVARRQTCPVKKLCLSSLTGKLAFSLLICLFGTWTVSAQSYLLQTGRPTFSTTWPVHSGFINIPNGNLHLEIPLATFPQRGGHTFSAKLVYDSRIWKTVFNGITYTWQPTNVAGSQGGWRFVTTADVGRVIFSDAPDLCDPGPGSIDIFSGFAWIAPDGTSHSFNIQTQSVSGTPKACGFRNTSAGASSAIDSSGLYMSVTNYTDATVYAPDGTQVYPSGACPRFS